MIRVAIDARTAFVGLVIADSPATPGGLPRCLFAGTRELGRNVKRTAEDEPSRLELRREVTDADIKEMCDAIHSEITRYVFGALTLVQIVIETPSGREFSRRFVNQCARSTPHICSVITSNRAGGSTAVPQAFEDWPDGLDDIDGWRIGDFAGMRDAGRMLLGAAPMVKVAPAARPASRPSLVQHDDVEDRIKAHLLEFSPPVLANASRVLAVNTGASVVGLCVAELAGPGPLRFRRVISRCLELDATDPAQRADFITGLARLIHAERVERVVIKQVTHVHGGGDQMDATRAVAVLRAMASEFVAANWLGGMVEALCLSTPVPIAVVCPSASHWRRRVCAGMSGMPSNDAGVSAKVREAFPEWPERSTTHERDAAGLIVWDAIGEPAAKKASAPRAKGPAKRRAGCTCPPGPIKGGHAKGCPLRAARGKGTVQLCGKCGAPRRGHKCTVMSDGQK